MTDMDAFRDELQQLINRHSLEKESDTPDFILADYLVDCLRALTRTVAARESWYGRALSARGLTPSSDTPESVAAKAQRARMVVDSILSATGQRDTCTVDTLTQKELATGQGYTGDCCVICHNFTMKRNGPCLLCQTCGATTGCD